MCLAVPGRIIEKRDTEATVDFQGSRVDVSLMLVPEASVGDWVLVHAGFAISQLDETDALETWSYLEAARAAADTGSTAADESGGAGETGDAQRGS